MSGGGKRWVVPDIHGCSKTLRTLVEDRMQPSKEDTLFFLGDYINRGPDSKGVIDFILSLKNMGYRLRALKGNHEEDLLMQIAEGGPGWLSDGKAITLQSFGVELPEDISQEYLAFFQELEYHVISGEFVLVHAGLNFEADDPFEDKYAMLWIRNAMPQPEKTAGRRVVHGHTPIPLDAIKASLEQDAFHTLNLDNGCVYYGRPGLPEGMGNLCALELNSMRLIWQKNLDIS